MDYEKLIKNLLDKGWCCSEEFLAPEVCQHFINHINSIPLRQARIGIGQSQQLHQEIRNDSIYWIEDETSHPLEINYLAEVDKIKNYINQSLYLGLKQFEGHYARYEQSGFYKKHLDQFVGNRERLVTIITYLNSMDQGGELRLYKKDSPDEIDCDLLPKAGSMVCFLSNHIYHEVLPTTKTRYSISGWLRTTIR